MTKEVVITQTGFQVMESEEETTPVETINAGEYYYKNGSHYLLFDEMTEDFDEPTHTMMKFKEGRLLVHKRGLINSEMLFEDGRNSVTSYETPYGHVSLGISTTGFSLKQTMEQIDFCVDYALSIDGNFMADCQIHLKIQPKVEGVFSLKDREK